MPAVRCTSILCRAPERIPLLFFGADGADISGSHVLISDSNQHGEYKMRQLLKVTAAPAATLFALAFIAMTTPATAKPGEYCRQDVTSGMRSCSFSSLEQCQAMSAGRGGSCYRDPFLTDTSNAYAYQPKHPLSKKGVRHVKTPLVNQ